ncbi:MAG: DUF2530 domain-containing protein [Streptomycetales bacterium]
MATRGNKRNKTGIPARVRHPDPPPFQTNDVRVVSIGTALWLVALLASLPFRDQLSEQGNGWWMWTCLAGFGLGLWGVTYCRRRAHRLAQQAPDDPARRHGAEAGRNEDQADRVDLEQTHTYPAVAEHPEQYGEPGYAEPGYADPIYGEQGYHDLGQPDTSYYEGPHTDPGLPRLPEPDIHDSGYQPAYDPVYDPVYDPAYDPASEQPSDADGSGTYISDAYSGEQPYPGYPAHDPYASYGADTGQHTTVFPYPQDDPQVDPAHGYGDPEQWQYPQYGDPQYGDPQYEEHAGYQSQEPPTATEAPFPHYPYNDPSSDPSSDPYSDAYEPPARREPDPPTWETQESAWWRD